MTAFVRAILWVLLIVAPGGVFLLPLLVGDAVARRKREEKSGAVRASGTLSTEASDPRLAAPAPGH